MKILNFGSCNLDYVYSVKHIVLPGETQSSGEMEIFPGGKGLNQSIAVAKAGVDVYHAGCVGEDGAILIDTLKKSGVNINYLQSISGKNGHAIIQVTDDGENSIVLYAGSNEKISTKLIDDVFKNFEKGDILLLQNEINNVSLIIERAYSIGMIIVLNPSPYNEKITNYDLSKVSYLILNEVEASGFSGHQNVEQSVAYFTKNYPQLKIVLTLGKKGCVYSDGVETVFQPSYDVHAVDTTGAGDTFTGYFVAGVSQNKKISDVLKVSSAAAALAVTRDGAAPSIPNIKEVSAFLNQKRISETEE